MRTSDRKEKCRLSWLKPIPCGQPKSDSIFRAEATTQNRKAVSGDFFLAHAFSSLQSARIGSSPTRMPSIPGLPWLQPAACSDMLLSTSEDPRPQGELSFVLAKPIPWGWAQKWQHCQIATMRIKGGPARLSWDRFSKAWKAASVISIIQLMYYIYKYIT